MLDRQLHLWVSVRRFRDIKIRISHGVILISFGYVKVTLFSILELVHVTLSSPPPTYIHIYIYIYLIRKQEGPSLITVCQKHTPLPLIVKGVQCVEDIEQCAKAGVDGVIISNHGGRQLDLYVPPHSTSFHPGTSHFSSWQFRRLQPRPSRLDTRNLEFLVLIPR